MSDPLVTVIIRSFNEGWALRGTLAALAAQEYENRELIVCDSGSTDGSVELIRNARPAHFIQIQPSEYIPGRVLNRCMALARSEFAIFLNADATPQNRNWLRPLVTALKDPRTAAAFGRQIPRPGCRAVYAHDYERCFGAQRDSAGWEHFFSLVSSGIRRDVWERRGFLETQRYSEDDEYSRWCRAQGFRVAYCPDSLVIHSHNYTPAQAYQRFFGEAFALAALRGPALQERLSRGRLILGWLADLRRDVLYCARRRRWTELPHAGRIRWHQRLAKLAGFRAGLRHYHEQPVHH